MDRYQIVLTSSRNFSDKPSKSKTLKKKQVINVEKNKKNLDEERKAHVQDED